MDQLIYWLFLILFCHQITAGEVAENPVAAAVRDESCSSNLIDRVSKLEAKDKHQEEEISFLKTTVHQLRGRVATLEPEGNESVADGLISSHQAKRPARLIPLQLLWY